MKYLVFTFPRSSDEAKYEIESRFSHSMFQEFSGKQATVLKLGS